MSRFFITGIAGFIGSNLARALRAQGHEVSGVDDLSTGKRENLHGLDIAWKTASILDADALAQAMRGAEFLLHQAAIPSVPKSVAAPLPSHDANITGTLNVLIAARDAGVKRVIYAASSSAYGETPTLPKNEEMAAYPISPYAVQKLAGEQYMRSFWKVYGLETVSLRYFNVFGPFQDASSQYSGVMAQFISKMLAGEQPSIFGDGEQSRDFTYIDNVVDANLKACTAPAAKVAGEVFNAACGGQVTVNRLFAECARLTGYSGKPRYLPARTGDILHSYADITKATRAFGYHPTVSFEDGLRRTVDWYRAAHEKAASHL